ncbi:MAG: hypothetical protein EXR77_05315 [Myxococcales bacterium]|nr:hypothetical protein [Myxococcales bacterium]
MASTTGALAAAAGRQTADMAAALTPGHAELAVGRKVRTSSPLPQVAAREWAMADPTQSLSAATKRVTSTPLFRPADSTAAGPIEGLGPPPAQPRTSSLPAFAAAAVANPVVVTPRATKNSAAVGHSRAQPRTQILVESGPDLVSRHAETVSIDSEAVAAVVARVKAAKRRTETPPIRKNDSRGLSVQPPNDLPASHPLPPQRHRYATAPFLASLSLCGFALYRQSIEYDAKAKSLLLSFPAGAPPVNAGAKLIWRDRDGTRHSFSADVLQALPSAAGGAVLVVSTASWTPADHQAMQAVLARLM